MAMQKVEGLAAAELSRRGMVRLVAGAGAAFYLANRHGSLVRAQAELPADAATEQTLRVGSGSTGVASFTFTPLQGGGDQQNWQTLQWVPPMYFDQDLTLRPGVFSEWESNDDGTEWTFTIDPRAQFSDGSPITAADVKGTWELMADPLIEHGRIVGYIGNVVGFADLREGTAEEITGLEVVDDQTLKVTLAKPDPVFDQRIATTHMNPVKAEQAKANPTEFWRPENTPAVSGPYVLSAYDPDAGTAALTPNSNWWMDEGPYLERVEFRFVPEQQVLGALVQNGEIDASLAPLQAEMMAAVPDYFRPIKAFGFNTFWFNVTNAPTDELAVRKALTLAVNFDDVFTAAYPMAEGVAVPAKQIVDQDLPCVDTENAWFQFDPEGAKAALAESSYGGAEQLPKVRVTPRGANPVLQRALETIIEAWRQNLGIVNVEFKSQPDEFGPDADKINVSRDDVVIRFPDTATYMWAAAHSAGPIATANANPISDMLGGYSNEELNALIDEALVLQPDDEQRCALALEAQELFINDYTALPFAEEIMLLNAREYVVGYAKGPDTTLIEPWKIYIKQHDS
jgi:peptide/nickel transport system substrate-binding protein